MESQLPLEKEVTLLFDTFAPSYIHTAIEEAGSVAEIAEIRKRKNYEALSAVHVFTPIAVETSGVFGPETRCFLHKLASRVRSVTNEEKSHFYLTQQLSVAIQWGNTLSILGTRAIQCNDGLTLLCYSICMFCGCVVLYYVYCIVLPSFIINISFCIIYNIVSIIIHNYLNDILLNMCKYYVQCNFSFSCTITL